MVLVPVRAFGDPVEAAVARSLLEAAGIPSLLQDDHIVTAQWLYSTAVGGVKLVVEDRDLERARSVLAEDRSADLQGIAEATRRSSEAEQCPVCGSAEVSAAPARRNWAALSLLLEFPFVLGRRRWRCSTCDHRWARRPSIDFTAPGETLAAERAVREESALPAAGLFFLIVLGIGVLAWVEHAIRVNPESL